MASRKALERALPYRLTGFAVLGVIVYNWPLGGTIGIIAFAILGQAFCYWKDGQFADWQEFEDDYKDGG